MTSLKRLPIIETENFWGKDGETLDTDFWTISSTTALTSVYDNGAIALQLEGDGSGVNRTSTITSKTDLRSLGPNFYFSVTLKVYSNVYDNQIYARLRIGSTNLLYVRIDDPANDSINLVLTGHFWCTMSGTNLIVRRTYLASGTEAAAGSDDVDIIADSSSINATSALYLDITLDCNTASNSNARSDSYAMLGPIIYTKQLIGSNGTQ